MTLKTFHELTASDVDQHVKNMHASGEMLAQRGHRAAANKDYKSAGLYFSDAGDHHDIRDALKNGHHDYAKQLAHRLETGSREHVHKDTWKHLGGRIISES